MEQCRRRTNFSLNQRRPLMLCSNLVQYSYDTSFSHPHVKTPLTRSKVPLNPAFNALQITSALTHLAASHLIISSETNLPYKPPRSSMPLLAHLIPDLQRSKVESEAVPSLKNVIVVENSDGRVETGMLKALRNYDDVISDGLGERLSEKDLNADEVVNIQFTSGTTSMPLVSPSFLTSLDMCLTYKTGKRHVSPTAPSSTTARASAIECS